MRRVTIVDYGMGNLDSVARATEECGGDPLVTSSAKDLATADRIILPGVGAFGAGMRSLRELELEAPLHEQVIGRGVPCLGICLGMQLLAKTSDEGVDTAGLGWIDAEVERFVPTAQDRRIPHIGWNEVVFAQDSPLFAGIPSGRDFYFVHSYHVVCRNEADVIARTAYCGGFVSAVTRGLIFGVQFHPEKSQTVGFQVLRNFLTL